MDEQTIEAIFLAPSQEEIHGEFQAINELTTEEAAAGCDGTCQSGTCK